MPATYIVVGWGSRLPSAVVPPSCPSIRSLLPIKHRNLFPRVAGCPMGQVRRPEVASHAWRGGSLFGRLLDQSHVDVGTAFTPLRSKTTSSRTFLSATCQSQLVISPARPSRYPGNLKNRTKPPAAQPRPGKGWAAGTPTKMTSSWYRGSLAH